MEIIIDNNEHYLFDCILYCRVISITKNTKKYNMTYKYSKVLPKSIIQIFFQLIIS